MYLVTVNQQLLGTDPLLLPEKKFHFTAIKELADWCHAFIRACSAKGWLKEEVTDRMLDRFLMPGPALLDVRKFGLAPRMTLRNKDNPKEVVIGIEHLEPMPAPHAAYHLTK